MGVAAVADHAARALWQRSWRQLVRTQLPQDLHRRHRGREPTASYAQFDPATIERLEVIRGPQGAALYGADANSGVINIVTRHDGTAPDGQRLELESTAGVSGSQFAPQGVLTQQHALAFRTGTSERSAGLGLNVATLGAYVPGAFARTVAANGDVRVVGATSVFTGIARVFSERAGSPSNPLLPKLTGIPGSGEVPQRNGSPSDPAERFTFRLGRHPSDT